MYALITDTHFGTRGESQIFLDAHTALLKSFFEFIDKNKIKKIIHTGDLFDSRKAVSSKLLNWVRVNWIEPIVKRKIECIVIAGNHDTHFRSTNTPNSVREVLSPYSKNFIVVDEAPLYLSSGINRFALFPWINPNLEQTITEDLSKNTYDIVFGHFDIIGAIMQGNQLSEHGLTMDMLKHHGKVISGHYHKRSITNNIHYLGNPVATSWMEYFDQHGWYTLDSDTLDLKFYEFDYPLYDRIYVNSETEILYEWSGAKFIKIDIDQKSEFWFQKLLTYLRSIPEIIQIQINDNTIETLGDSVTISEDELKDDLVTIMNRAIDESADLASISNEMKKLIAELHEEISGKGIIK